MSRPATTRLKVNPPVGEPPELEWIGVHAIRVDEAYQRSLQSGISQTLIRRIAQFWDWRLCQPLACSRRGDRHGLFVVDGQHRLAAAVMRGDISQLPCIVSYFATAADEAASFVELNQQRRPLTALDLFRAALAAGDDAAHAISGLVAGAGLSLAPHSNHTAWKPGMVSNIAGIQRCYRVHGEHITQIAPTALAKAFAGQVLRYAGSLFPGTYGFAAQEMRFEGRVDADRLAGILGRRTQHQWRQEITLEQAAAGVDRNLAAKTVVAKAYRGAGKPSVALVQTPPRPQEHLPPAMMVFCEQCDRRVSGAEANRCSSPFCKARAEVA